MPKIEKRMWRLRAVARWCRTKGFPVPGAVLDEYRALAAVS